MKFYGKAYSHKGKIIGVCDLPGVLGQFVIAKHDTQTDTLTFCELSFNDPDIAQDLIDTLAKGKGLPEAN